MLTEKLANDIANAAQTKLNVKTAGLGPRARLALGALGLTGLTAATPALASIAGEYSIPAGLTDADYVPNVERVQHYFDRGADLLG